MNPEVERVMQAVVARRREVAPVHPLVTPWEKLSWEPVGYQQPEADFFRARLDGELVAQIARTESGWIMTCDRIVVDLGTTDGADAKLVVECLLTLDEPAFWNLSVHEACRRVKEANAREAERELVRS